MAENDSNAGKDGGAPNAQPDQPRFQIQKVYTKDVSFESPHAPQIFTDTRAWQPEINLQLNAETKPLGEDLYEVTLSVNVTAKQGEQTAFLVELKQAGIFTLSGFDKNALGHMLGSYCPNLLFPFAREAISDFVGKGGFPQLLLAPINFDALYAQHMAKAGNVTAESSETAQ